MFKIINGVQHEKLKIGTPIRATDYYEKINGEVVPWAKSRFGDAVKDGTVIWRACLKRGKKDTGLKTLVITTEVEVEENMPNVALREYLDRKVNVGEGVFLIATQNSMKIKEKK